MRTFSIQDLELYSYCPRYYEFNRELTKNSVPPNRELDNLVSDIGIWMMAYTIRKAKNPDYLELDKLFANKIVSLGLEEKTRDILWVRLRQLLHRFVPEYTPAHTSVPLRFLYQGRVLTSTIPVLAEYSGHNGNKILPVFFRTLNPIHYRHDLWLNFCMAKLAVDYPHLHQVAHVFDLNPEFSTIDRHSFTLDSLDPDKVLDKIGKLLVAVDSGPWHPIDRCVRKNCQFWEECTL